MELAVITSNFNLLSFGIVFGIIPCLIWGRIGGDEGFTNVKTRAILKLIHHWHVGVLIMIIGVFTNVFILGWGAGTAIDDLLFHSFENYFMRKE